MAGGKPETPQPNDGKFKFKMESMRTLKDLVTKNDWMISIDLKDAYFSVLIDKKNRKHLRFM